MVAITSLYFIAVLAATVSAVFVPHFGDANHADYTLDVNFDKENPEAMQKLIHIITAFNLEGLNNHVATNSIAATIPDFTTETD